MCVCMCACTCAAVQLDPRAAEAFAADRGLAFIAGHDSSHDERFSRFGMFRRGHSRAAFNTMDGTMAMGDRSVRVRAGDFRFREQRGSGKNRRTVTVKLSYFIMWNPFGEGPETIVRREGIFDRLKGVLGFDDAIGGYCGNLPWGRRLGEGDRRRIDSLFGSVPKIAFPVGVDYVIESTGKFLTDPEALKKAQEEVANQSKLRYSQ